MVQNARSLFKSIYKIGMILVTLTLGGLAVIAYLSSTPANGLLLIAGILGLLTLIAGLSITKLDWQDQRAETYRQIGQDFRRLVKVSTHHIHSEPEVRRVDLATVERAKAMAADGAPIDEICRMVDPGHDSHDEAYREAFRRMVKAMIEHS